MTRKLVPNRLDGREDAAKPWRTLALAVFPYYPDNDWQEIMYGDLRRDGIEIKILESIRVEPWMREILRDGGSVVLHLNWTAPISQRADNVVASMTGVLRVLDELTQFRELGGRIVWTVHNVLPHEMQYLSSELVLCQGLATLADTIMIMNPDTPRLVSDWYTLPPAKTTQIDHPSYLGRFPNTVSAVEARRAHGLNSDDIVLLFVGSIRPYKGLADLIPEFDKAHAKCNRLKLLVAGPLGPGYSNEQIDELFAPRAGLTAEIGYIEPDRMQYWCNAADVMVLPYRESLNVSVVSLAASFGLPVSIRRAPSSAYLHVHDWVSYMDSNQLETDLLAAGLRFHGDIAARHAANAAALATSPVRVAREFASTVRELASL
ncbi:glycosyltransferase [Cryobacterium ruanii]|uniref:Glycosyltransferase n=1 Tax=Cryobacterium ruanii TaxID=1259197 RepID=A0A4R9ASX5_9MICO|nr:glycosyltransferase [Cryobacterium ruanii]TFD69377.1 glycosyltransferase [Cryobacterium ruanii]